MFSHLLVAHDGSKCSDGALDYAAMLAKSLSSTVTVCHVTNYTVATLAMAGPGIGDPAPVYEALDAEREDVKRHVNERLQSRGIVADFVDVTDVQSRGILDAATSSKADLIVVGCHHRGWLEKLIDPSVSARVAGAAPIPVLVVPEEAPAV